MKYIFICVTLICVVPLCNAQSRSIGIVTLGNYEEGDSLVFLNRDGKSWLRFDPYFRSDESQIVSPEGFNPLAFHPDYFLLVLRSFAMEGNRAEVVVDEESGLTKLVELENPVYKFVRWEVFLKELFSVGLLDNTPSFRMAPDSSSAIIDRDEYDSYEVLRITQVEGEWVRIDWGGLDFVSEGYGWVPWRNSKDELLLQFYYFA